MWQVRVANGKTIYPYSQTGRSGLKLIIEYQITILNLSKFIPTFIYDV